MREAPPSRKVPFVTGVPFEWIRFRQAVKSMQCDNRPIVQNCRFRVIMVLVELARSLYGSMDDTLRSS
jgi:hypothetical protein